MTTLVDLRVKFEASRTKWLVAARRRDIPSWCLTPQALVAYYTDLGSLTNPPTRLIFGTLPIPVLDIPNNVADLYEAMLFDAHVFDVAERFDVGAAVLFKLSNGNQDPRRPSDGSS